MSLALPWPRVLQVNEHKMAPPAVKQTQDKRLRTPEHSWATALGCHSFTSFSFIYSIYIYLELCLPTFYFQTN